MVVVDDPTLFAESLRTALSLAGYDVHWFSAAAASATSMELLSADGTTPAAAVLDLDLTAAGSAEAILGDLVAQGIPVAVLTAVDDHSVWARCLELGASGVIPKTLPLAELVALVGRLASGEAVITPWERRQLRREKHDKVRRERDLALRFSRLDEAEEWVLGQLVQGVLAADIAQVTGRPAAEVNALVSSILTKLDVTTWLGAVSLANDYGWFPPGQTG